MRPTALKRRAARMLMRHGDEMTPPQREAVERALADPVLLKRWADKVNEIKDQPSDLMQGIAWDRVWDWFKANWPTILKLLFSLLIMLDTKHADS
jgi:hypothetical protein